MKHSRTTLLLGTVLLGALGASLAAWSLAVALACFALSGLCLAVSMPASGGLGQLPWRPSRVGAGFGALLALWALALGTVRLGSVPPGPGFVESAMSVMLDGLDKQPYTPHLATFQVVFPTLVFYQGLAAAKALGWTLLSLRLPAALWGALAVVTFYYLLRQMVSGFSAALFAVLFSVNNLFLTQSRIFFPGSLLYFSSTASALLLLLGLRQGGLGLFLAAGLACGLSFHGYVPGRTIFFLLLAWLLWLHWQQRGKAQRALRASQTAVFVLGALLAALPVLWWVWRNPGPYFEAVTRYGGGLVISLARLRISLPEYVRVFFCRADGGLEPTDGLARFALLQPDLMMKVLMPAGLVACLAGLRKPVPSLVLGGFLMGLLPAALAGDLPLPNTRRMLLTLPWAYAAGALAFDRLRAAAEERAGLRRYQRVAALGAVLAVTVTVLLSLGQYFVQIMGRPSVRNAYYATAGLMEEERRSHAQDTVRASYSLLFPGTHQLLFPPELKSRALQVYPNFIVQSRQWGALPTAIKQFEDFLVLPNRNSQLLLLAPYLHTAQPFLQALFPGGHARLYQEARQEDEAFLAWDDVAPMVQLLSFEVPQADAQAFRGLVDLGLPPYAGPQARLDLQDPAFAEKHRATHLRLGGVLVVSDGRKPLRLSLLWPGWALQVDGQAADWGRPLRLSPGAHRLALTGRVPAGAQGPLPLRVEQGGADLVGKGALVPVDPRYGMQLELRSAVGHGHSIRRVELLPSHRFLPPEGVDAPCTVRVSGRLQVPRDGPYRVALLPPLVGKVWAQGRVVYDSAAPDAVAELRLRAAQPTAFRAEGHFGAGPKEWPTLQLMQKGPADSAWAPLPFDWVLAP